MAWESKLDNTVWTGKATPYPALWQTYGASGWHMELSNDLSGGQTYAEITALPGQFIKNYSKVRFGLRYTWYADLIIHYTAGADFQLYAEEETEYNLPTDRGYITGIEWTQLDRTFGSIGIDLQSLEFYYEEPPPSSEDYALAVDAPGQTFTSGGNSVCSIDTTVYHFGNSSVKSGSISDDGFSWLQTVVSGAGSGSFLWKVSSEQDYDFLKFYIDGIEQDAISGEVAWVKYDFAVSAGQHTLKWEYSKDGSASGGTDAGWIDLFTFTSSGFNPDTVRNEYIFQTVLSGDSDIILPCTSVSVQHKIEMYDADGEVMPAWESTADPGANGYDLTKSKYRIFFNATVPGGDFASEIAARLGNDLILYISTQTTNGVPGWQEMIRAVSQTGIPHEGGESESIQLYAESEIILSDAVWDYQEFTVDRMSYRSPNQADGKYTFQVPGIITDIQPGFKADSIVLGEIQHIISPSGIQTYLKEY